LNLSDSQLSSKIAYTRHKSHARFSLLLDASVREITQYCCKSTVHSSKPLLSPFLISFVPCLVKDLPYSIPSEPHHSASQHSVHIALLQKPNEPCHDYTIHLGSKVDRTTGQGQLRICRTAYDPLLLPQDSISISDKKPVIIKVV